MGRPQYHPHHRLTRVAFGPPENLLSRAELQWGFRGFREFCLAYEDNSESEQEKYCPRHGVPDERVEPGS